MEARAYRTLLVAQTGAVATITMNKPERKNPLGPEMVNELCWALDDAKDDASVRAVVLTGAGGAFSAGGDLKQMSGGTDGGPEPLAPRGDYVDLLLRFTTIGKPTIARVPGIAMGGGLGLVASCDFAIGCESATFGTPEIKRGLFPMMIMAVLRRVVSRRRLMDMMLLGEKLDAREAERIELISRCVPDAELDAAVSALAEKLAAQSPTAMRMGLAAFHAQADRDLAGALPYLRDRLVAILGTEDAREGLMAFMEKRTPQWTGR
ncbi:enoyl-CoA hydratase-related protein [Sandaracinus amylolyticus]|uniref:enoyl-CoA hydratase-related protein n=1 Tax=Sandaracinus amylolyticus TaxID=927083 RepID=UPI001F0153F0|nr:enoyl-CoA hydratase-related protein [Sandaracinus amylolyticus]UJR79786.1 Methylglutaconyl-CoA hydratase [Sandaracinus amylolyticus]